MALARAGAWAMTAGRSFRIAVCLSPWGRCTVRGNLAGVAGACCRGWFPRRSRVGVRGWGGLVEARW